MANTPEIPGWAAGLAALGTMIGAAWAAVKAAGQRLKPDSDPEKEQITDMLARIHELERRTDRIDTRLDDVFRLLGNADEALGRCQIDIREALTRLEERRKHR